MATVLLPCPRVRAVKQGRPASSARPAIAPKLGIIVLRYGISVFDGALRKPGLRFGILLFAIYVDGDRIFQRPMPK
jgi:hypothetical protein